MQKERVLKAGAVLLAAGCACAGIYLLRPPCLILEHTGFYCAGCGTQRMLTALLRGDIPGAFSHNPFMFLCLPLAVLYVLWEASRYVRGRGPLWQTKGARIAALAVLALALAFTAVRNLPGVTVLGP